jgi:hypothetical protein
MSKRDRWRRERRPRRRPPKGVVRPLPPIEITPPPAEPRPVEEATEGPIAAEPPPPAPEEPPTPPPAPPRPERDLFLIIVLIVLAALSFLPALSGEFVWDDTALIVDNGIIRSPANTSAIFGSPFLAERPNSYHPVATLTYMTDYQVWRLNPNGYHTTNLTLHLIATLLVYVVAMQLLGRRAMAFAAGAVFAVHPVHVQAVAWVAARPQLVATCLALFSFLCYTYYVSSFEDLSDPRRRHPAYYWLSLIAFILALFAHAAAAALLILLPLYEVVLARRRLALKKGGRVLVPYIGFAAGGCLYLFARWSALGGHLAIGFDAKLWPAHIYTCFGFAVRAVELLLLPVREQLYIPVVLVQTPLRADVIIAAAAMAVLVALIVRARALAPVVAFAAWWSLLTLAPSLNLIPLSQPQFGERNLYLPSVGVALILGWAVVGMSDLAAARSRRLLRSLIIGAFAVAVAVSMVAAQRRSGWYRDDITFFKQMARTEPNLFLPHYNLGNAYLLRGDAKAAIEEYERALAVHASSRAYYNEGQAYMVLSQYDEAVAAYRAGLALDPRSRLIARALYEAMQAASRKEGKPAKPTGLKPGDRGFYDLLGKTPPKERAAPGRTPPLRKAQ